MSDQNELTRTSPLMLHPSQLHRLTPAARTDREPLTMAILERRNLAIVNRVAVVTIQDVLVERDSFWSGVPMDLLGNLLANLATDPGVSSILLDVDSPGGTVFGAFELWDKIRALRDLKPIKSIANAQAASSAFGLFSSADERFVTPSGQVGSVGVIFTHMDFSQMDEKLGIKTTIIKSSERKAEMSNYGPLDDEAKAEAQRIVNHYHAMFVDRLAKGFGVSKGKVEQQFGAGRMIVAEQAVNRGMADKVATFDQVLAKLSGKAEKTAKRYNAEIEKKRLDLRSRGR